MKKNKNSNGEIIIISMIFIACAFTIIFFVISIFMSHINSILYNIKIDMYSLNRSAIISVNKLKTSIDDFSYNMAIYKEEFVNGLKKNYDLNDELENSEKLISKFEIIEYQIYEDKQRDSYTNKSCDGRCLHTVLKVKIKPIILSNVLEDIFVFTIHEDVALNSMKIKK